MEPLHQALSLDPWIGSGSPGGLDVESAFWDRRIGSAEVLIDLNPKGTESETTARVVGWCAGLR